MVLIFLTYPLPDLWITRSRWVSFGEEFGHPSQILPPEKMKNILSPLG